MSLDPESLRARIQAALPDAAVDVRDTTGGGDHFSARVVSAAFAGQSPLERHRTVYGALAELLRGPLHALSLETLTPAEDREKTS